VCPLPEQFVLQDSQSGTTTVRTHDHFSQSNHRGTYQSWITNFVETIRQYQGLQTDENKLSDQMCIDFLNNSLRGTPQLEGVLDTYYTARKASGHPHPFDLTFAEYVERLIQAAQPHNASVGQSRNCGSRSAKFRLWGHNESNDKDNVDSDDDEDCPLPVLQAYKSDWDQKSSGRKVQKGNYCFYKKPGTPSKQRAMIPRSKWNTFSRKDQIAWAKLTKQAKRAILNSPGNKKGSDSNPVVVVNNHKMAS